MRSRKPLCLLLSIVFLFAFAVSVQANPGSVTRSMTPATPGGEVTVTLTVDVDGERFYAIDEDPPDGFEIVNAGDLVKDPSDHLKKVVFQNAADTTFSYILKAPTTIGEYSFSGIYQMDGMDSPADIGGFSSITIQQGGTGPVDMTVGLIVGIIVVIVLVVIVALFMLKKKPAK